MPSSAAPPSSAASSSISAHSPSPTTARSNSGKRSSVSRPIEEMCGPPTITVMSGSAFLMPRAMSEADQTPTVKSVMPT